MARFEKLVRVARLLMVVGVGGGVKGDKDGEGGKYVEGSE